MNNFPIGLGPHEERELELMLLGQKNIAMFECVPQEFESYLQEGRFKYLAHDDYTHIIYCPNYEQEVMVFTQLIDESRVRGFVADLERKIGQALGYSEQEIEVYLHHIADLLVEDDNA